MIARSRIRLDSPTLIKSPQPQAAPEVKAQRSAAPLRVALFTGCKDRPYAVELAVALAATGASVDFIGDKTLDCPELHVTPRLSFLDFKGIKRSGTFARRIASLFSYYVRVVRYAASSDSGVFHILWNNRLEFVDRTLLTCYYKLMRKKVVLTAHNVNQAKRDRNDSILNRLTLKWQYRLIDHLFVHTRKMKDELVQDFGVHEDAVTIVNHPINTAFPNTALTPAEARRRLAIPENAKVLLFFGRISPYKGLEYLVTAFQELVKADPEFRLIIAGQPKKGNEGYLAGIYAGVREADRQRIILRGEFIPDSDIELYMKAADVLVLPYTDIAQSGVLFLAHTFGLPVVAADVGAFRETVIEEKTGFLFTPQDPGDLVKALGRYFSSELFTDLGRTRENIREHFLTHHSWHAVARQTEQVYQQLMRH
jgi:glycosyltransferase involved in cell wall biosynthesis